MALDNAWYGLVWHPDGTQALLRRRRPEQRAGVQLRRRRDHARADVRAARRHRPELRRRARDQPRRQDAVSSRACSRRPVGDRPRERPGHEDRHAAGRAVQLRGLCRRHACSTCRSGAARACRSTCCRRCSCSQEFTPASTRTRWCSRSDGKRLFVACGNSAVGLGLRHLLGRGDRADLDEPVPERAADVDAQLAGALARRPDAARLQRRQQRRRASSTSATARAASSDGFIPTGWYPTGAIFSRDGKQIFILSGKGLVIGRQADRRRRHEMRLQGAVSTLPVPDRDDARRVHAQGARADAVHATRSRMSPTRAGRLADSARRRRQLADQARLLHHPREPHLRLDPRRPEAGQRRSDADAVRRATITPNAHALAQQFVLFDNFYVDADVSYDGHAFSTAAYATDFIQKMWQTFYANRGGVYLGEGGGFMRNAVRQPHRAARPATSGTTRARAGVSVRSYGEFVQHHRRSRRPATSSRSSRCPG